MKNLKFRKKYPAFTLLEMLIVMSIITILLTMTLTAFGGLRNTIRMNEYMLNLEQDVRSVQRAAMLVERNPSENWLYGLGIDFTRINEDNTAGDYRMFKWCSPEPDYGHISTRSNVPGFVPGEGDLNGNLPIPTGENDFSMGVCTLDKVSSLPGELYFLSGYSKPMSPPISNIVLVDDVGYVLFESVSGRAFLYNIDGELLNYIDGELIDGSDIQNLTINFKPIRGTGKTRSISIMNLSGKIDTHMF